MHRKVFLTNLAEDDLENVTDFLFNHWGINVTNEFISKFEDICTLISQSPEQFPLFNKKRKIRKCILTKQNTIYYRIQPEQIEIITIFDSRQQPAKLKKLLSS